MIKEYPFDLSVEENEFHPEFYNSNPYLNRLNGISHFHLKSGIYNCSDCNYHSSEYPLSFSNKNAPIMAITKYPSEVHPSGNYGKFLMEQMKNFSISLEEIYFTSLYKSEQAEKPCYKHLLSEVIVNQPAMILSFDLEVPVALLGIQQPPGTGLTLTNGSDMVVMHNLKDIYQNIEMYRNFSNHMNIAISQLQNRKKEILQYAGV